MSDPTITKEAKEFVDKLVSSHDATVWNAAIDAAVDAIRSQYFPMEIPERLERCLRQLLR